MRCPQATLLAVVAQFSFLATATGRDRENLGQWTVSDFRRTCPVDTRECNFSFSLAVAQDTDTIYCSFSVRGSDDHPTAQLDFHGAKCNEKDDYTISLGWNDAGFIVIVIDDEFHGLQSFFGFRDEELDHGEAAKPKSRSVQRSRPADPPAGEQLPRQEDLEAVAENKEPGANGETGLEKEVEVLGSADEWTLTKMVRDTFNDDEHPAVMTIFNIEHLEFEPEVCVAMAYGEAGADPRTMSFYDVPCAGSNWTVSWGYDADAEEDVAVMTLMSPWRNRRAYFGFRHVNHGRDLGDNGPEPTYPY